MIKNQFKNQIMYEIEEKDIVSKLGVNSVIRTKHYMLPLREIGYNGKKTIVCGTEKYIKETVSGIDENKMIVFIKSLSELLKLCVASAFLDRSYIDITNETIFYDRDDDAFRLPVVPVDNDDSIAGKENWDDAIRSFIVDMLSGAIFNESLLQFRYGFLKTDDVIKFIGENAALLTCTENGRNIEESELKLEYSGRFGAFSFFICKDEFVIGKDNNCDGVLSMNPAVSRRHCMFKRTRGGWYVEDLGSSNGTCLGEKSIEQGKPMRIRDGEKIRISDMEFTIHFS